MIWRWFSDWREQRAVMREFDQARRAEESALALQLVNPLSLALKATQLGDLPEAAVQWEEARRRMPNVIRKSHDSLDIVLALKRYDEAEALMAEGMRRFPRQRHFHRGFAEVADQRGDFAEAAKRWQAIRYGSDEMEGDLRTGRCFQRLERLPEARAMFERAARRVPDQPQPLIELARISETLGDWADARTRWRGLIDRFNLPLGMAREAWALKELGQPEAAEAALERILPNHSRDLDIALVRAHLAESRGDLPAACERWQFIRRINAFFPAGYQEGARCLFMVERYAEADTVMRDAMERFPAEAWPLRGYGHLAHDRQEWAMAAERWLELRRRFPSDQVAASLGISALRAAGREDEAAALERGA